MRTNLITKFFCNDCGYQLNVEYDSDESPKKIASQHQTDKEPTGACCRYNRILVQPCRHCIEKHTSPAKQLGEALREIMRNES